MINLLHREISDFVSHKFGIFAYRDLEFDKSASNQSNPNGHPRGNGVWPFNSLNRGSTVF